MTERRYDYLSRRSTSMMNLIRRFVFDASKRKRNPGVTQNEVAKHLAMSVTGVGRYLAYMVDEGMIHTVHPPSNQRGHQPALYFIGPAPPPMKPKKTIFKDPLMAAFYGRSE